MNLDPLAPDEFAKGKLGAAQVLVQPLFEPFDDMDKICATSSITIYLPSKGYATCRPGRFGPRHGIIDRSQRQRRRTCAPSADLYANRRSTSPS